MPLTRSVGGVIGLLNGVFVAVFRMNSLIATLAMGLFLQGAVLGLTKARTITITDPSYTYIGAAVVGSWPVMPVVLFAAYAVGAVLLLRTRWGRNLYATGGSPSAAFVAGIRIRRVRLGAFVAAGLPGGVAGFLSSAYLGG